MKGDKPTLKQKRFAKEYLETANATEAAARVYDVKNRNVANNIGAENLAKPSVLKILEKAAPGAMERIEEMSCNAESETVKLNANKDVVDRAGYKATDKTDITSGGEKIELKGSEIVIDEIIKEAEAKIRAEYAKKE